MKETFALKNLSNYFEPSFCRFKLANLQIEKREELRTLLLLACIKLKIPFKTEHAILKIVLRMLRTEITKI